jgi:hypothetical protein
VAALRGSPRRKRLDIETTKINATLGLFHLEKHVFSKSYSAETIRWRDGDSSKPNPFFILVVNNIALERPIGSGNFVDDFAAGDPASRKQFTECAEYIGENLFGKVPGQKEQVLSSSPYAAKIRFWSMYVYGLVSNGATALTTMLRTPEILGPCRTVRTGQGSL